MIGVLFTLVGLLILALAAVGMIQFVRWAERAQR